MVEAPSFAREPIGNPGAGNVLTVAHMSSPELLALHAVRIKGMADEVQISQRFALEPQLVHELLLDYEAYGWTSRVAFADVKGWALTAGGRAENERRLAAELDQTGTRSGVDAAHAVFLALNARFLATVTNWQIRPNPADQLAANDHTDLGWDQCVLEDLRRGVGLHVHPAPGDGPAVGGVLGGDVDHAGTAQRVEGRELRGRHGREV